MPERNESETYWLADNKKFTKKIVFDDAKRCYRDTIKLFTKYLKVKNKKRKVKMFLFCFKDDGRRVVLSYRWSSI